MIDSCSWAQTNSTNAVHILKKQSQWAGCNCSSHQVRAFEPPLFPIITLPKSNLCLRFSCCFDSIVAPFVGFFYTDVKLGMYVALLYGSGWGKTVNSSANIRSKTGYSVLVTGADGFFRTHISAILKRHDDCVLGLDNFNNYYDPTLEGLVKFCWKKVGFLLWKGT
ncbi:putative UDP-glucuronate 4-epimerase [Helianthus annuus]|nr:putative UDP-glucuronate 4-epimerase [Helianthus annuus]